MEYETCYLSPNPVVLGTLKARSMNYASAMAWFEQRLANSSRTTIQKALVHLEGIKSGVIKENGINNWNLECLFRTFNESIFGGVFSNRCLLKIILQEDKEWGADYTGYCASEYESPGPRSGGQGHIACKIGICEVGPDEDQDLVKKINVYSETLLHEMCHAFLIVAVCACHKCHSLHMESEGVTGHGIIWQKLAAIVQNYAKEQLGLRDLCLNRESSLGLEIYLQYLVTGKWYAKVPEMQLLGLDVAKVMKYPVRMKIRYDRQSVIGKVTKLKEESLKAANFRSGAEKLLWQRIQLVGGPQERQHQNRVTRSHN